MSDGTLYLGNRRYSSWSLRGWLAVRLAGLDVTETVIPFTPDHATPGIRAVSPSGLVPCLVHRGATVWESLSVVEYCAEQASLWPADRVERAYARSICAEMHAGFRGLRESMWMNLGADFTGRGRSEAALADIARIEAIWAEALRRSGGPFLSGAAFGPADAMFAPVVTRFLTWRPILTEATHAYCRTVRAHPLVSAWYEAALAEPEEWRLAEYEPVPEVGGPSGPDPTRYGDWEHKGRAIDF